MLLTLSLKRKKQNKTRNFKESGINAEGVCFQASDFTTGPASAKGSRGRGAHLQDERWSVALRLQKLPDNRLHGCHLIPDSENKRADSITTAVSTLIWLRCQCPCATCTKAALEVKHVLTQSYHL